jgi:hypothetical protein
MGLNLMNNNARVNVDATPVNMILVGQWVDLRATSSFSNGS